MHNIALVWDNLGPTHVDRCAAVAEALGEHGKLTAIEICASSNDYGWRPAAPVNFDKISLFRMSTPESAGALKLALRLVRACRAARARTVFLWGYQLSGVFIAACAMRLLGIRVLIFNDSKFDDKPRYLSKELAKILYCLPFNGGITASTRGVDYLRLRGFRKRPIELYYDNISIDRVRRLAGMPPAPEGVNHAERNFLCVARLVEKKNHPMLLRAFALYRRRTQSQRRLIVCGSGPLEPELRRLAGELEIAEHVEFTGWVQEEDIARHLGRALCLILPSLEEQFGIAVLEAQAMGLPVIVSENVGARDLHVRSGVNGFVVESWNPVGIAYFMERIAGDAQLWRELSTHALAGADLGDVRHFVASVFKLARIDLR